MSLASLAPGVVGESWFILGTYAFYARLNVRSPLRSMVLRVGLSVGLMALAWSIRGPSILPLLGLSLSAGSFVGAAHAWRRLRASLPSTDVTVSSTPFARVLLASILMLIPAAATAWAVGRLPSTQLTEVTAMVCAAIVGASVYFWLHHRWRAPELDWLRSGLAGQRAAVSGRGDRMSAQLVGRGRAPRRRPTRWRGSGCWLPWFSSAARSRSCRPSLLLAAAAALAVMTAVVVHPPIAAYALIGITPLVAGIDRGRVLPVLRPAEGLAVVLAGGARSSVASWGLRSGHVPRLRLSRTDTSILLLAVTSSILPLAWMMARQLEITQDDVLYALMIWKYYGVYLIIRFSIRGEDEVRRCLWVSMMSASIVAVIAILQSLQLFGITRLLGSLFAAYGDVGSVANNRGGSTLSLPIAVADLMILNLAIAIGLLREAEARRGLLLAAAGLFVVGVLASGQISAVIALVLALVALAVLTRRIAVLAGIIPLVLSAGLVLRPVIERRLEGFQSASGLPESWQGRWFNLTNYFWPPLFSDNNFLLGVRVSARVATTKIASGYIWIESGYTWLLWSGGIPLLRSLPLLPVGASQAGHPDVARRRSRRRRRARRVHRAHRRGRAHDHRPAHHVSGLGRPALRAVRLDGGVRLARAHRDDVLGGRSNPRTLWCHLAAPAQQHCRLTPRAGEVSQNPRANLRYAIYAIVGLRVASSVASSRRAVVEPFAGVCDRYTDTSRCTTSPLPCSI